MSDKIKAHHLTRKAVLYIRQSSPGQVLQNQESQRLQYAMEQRLRQLGWTDVEIIDEDLGRSAAGLTTRRLRADGGGSVPWPGRRRGGTRSVTVRAEQPRVAATGRGLPHGRFSTR